MLPPQTGVPNLSESTRIATMDLRVLDWQQPVQLVDYKIGPAILYGAAFPRLLVPDQPLPVTLFWQAEAISREDYQVIVQLLDDRGQVWSLNEGEQAVHGAYPTSYWQPNVDRIADHHELQLKDELPVGRYRLAVALFDVARNIRLPVSPAEAAPDTAFLGPLKVAPTFDLTQGPAVDVATTFEGVADLQGYTLEAESLTVGQPLNIDLWWQTTAAVEVDYTVFVHLLDKAGQRVAGQDSQPVGGTYPTTLWDPGERVVDHHTVDTSTVPPGRYRLAVGLYEGISGVRVPVTGQPDSMMILPTSIEIGTE
jgi:hypothetical protein